MAEQKLVPIQLIKSIDTSSVQRDTVSFEAQPLIYANTGICREGGVTNLQKHSGDDSAYEETYYCSNGSKAKLLRDTPNSCFQAYANDRNVGKVPLWAVKSRGLISANVSDVLVTVDGTVLLLYFTSTLATIEEINPETFDRINIQTFTIPPDLSGIVFARPKRPTYANVTSIGAYMVQGAATSKIVNGYVVTTAGTLVWADYVDTKTISSPVSIHCYYEHGWIFEIDLWDGPIAAKNLWMITTAGSASTLSSVYNSRCLIQDYKSSDDSVKYRSFIDIKNTFVKTTAIGGTSRNWSFICKDPQGTLWATVVGGDIYKCPAGSTTFTAIGGPSRLWEGICSDSQGNIWACVASDDIYFCAHGTTTFTAIGGVSRDWRGICADIEDNIWASVNGGDIYKKTADSGSFIAIGGATRFWYGLCSDSQGNIYAVERSGYIYKCPHSSIVFSVFFNQIQLWIDITADDSDNLYATTDYYPGITVGDIYRCPQGSDVFTANGETSKSWFGICVDNNGLVWAVVYGGDIYRQVLTITNYAIQFTPPAADGGSWAYSFLTDASITAVVQQNILTFGGFGVRYSTEKYSYFNLKTVRNYVARQKDIPEIYGNLWPELSEVVFKTHTISGLGSYLSASFNTDGIGVPITEVGELAPYYFPNIVKLDTTNYMIVYQRGNNQFAYIVVSSDAFDRMTEIKPGIIKVNCASGLNIIDTISADLKMGGNAFNGFAVVAFNSISQMGAWAARHRGTYGGSIDVGYKNNTALVAGNVSSVTIPESVQYSPNNEAIDIYVGLPPSSLNYFESIMSGNSVSYNSALLNTLYVDDQIIPIPAGATISERTAILIATTALRESDYDGYQLGNEVPGAYDSFVLYSSVYFVDESWIKGISVSAGNVIQAANKIVPVEGLRYIAASPQEAFFISDFDNSLFSFSGGQAVNKGALFNRKTKIVTGVYSVIENTLALLTDETILFIRDGIISETPFDFVDTPRPFTTIEGIWLTYGGISARYCFCPIEEIDGGIWGTVYDETLDGGTWGATLPEIDGGTWENIHPVPLLWQSKFLGNSDRSVQMLDRIIIRLYKDDRQQTDVTVTFEYYNEKTQSIDTRIYTIGDIANPWDTEGYAYIEYIPVQKRSVAMSLRIECDNHILILSAIAKFSDAGETVIGNR